MVRKARAKAKAQTGERGFASIAASPGTLPHNVKNQKEKVMTKDKAKEGERNGGSKGVNSLVDVLKAAGLQMLPVSEQSFPQGTLNLVRPMCCIIDPAACQHLNGREADFPPLSNDWKTPKRTAKQRSILKKIGANRAKVVFLSVFLQAKADDDEDEASESCLQQTRDDSGIDNCVKVSRGATPSSFALRCHQDTDVEPDDHKSDGSRSEFELSDNPIPSGSGWPTAKAKSGCINVEVGRVNCLSRFAFNNISDQKSDEVDDKIENLRVLTDQLKKSLMKVQQEDKIKDGWTRVSLIVESGACETVADPRAFPGYPLDETAASRVGEVFLTVAGDPIPQLGEKQVLICTESGDIRSIKAQCSIVAKPLLSVKRMTEAEQFVGFCKEGGFVLDSGIGKVDWFREESGNYILDIWLVPHDKVNDVVEAIGKSGFTRSPK